MKETLDFCPNCGMDVRKDEPRAAGPFKMGPYDLRPFVYGRRVQLTHVQAALLWTLLRVPNTTVSHDALCERSGVEGVGNLRVQIHLLRNRLGLRAGTLIRGVRNQGYRLLVDEDAR